MRLSVLIPARGFSKQLEELIASLGRQSLPSSEFEIVVALNEDDPIPPALLTKHQIKTAQTNGRGANRARNLAISMASGEILLFLDDDCRLPHPNFLEEILTIHQERDACVIGGHYLSPEGLSSISHQYNEMARQWLQAGSRPEGPSTRLLGGNFSVKFNQLKGLLKFDESIEFGGAETELWQRLTKAGIRLHLDSRHNLYHCPQLGYRDLWRKAFAQGFHQHQFGFEARESAWVDNSFARKIYRHGFRWGRGWSQTDSRLTQWAWPKFMIWNLIRDAVSAPMQVWRRINDRQILSETLPLDYEERFWLLNLQADAHAPVEECCHLMACRGDRALNFQEIDRQLKAAKKLGYQAVVLPCWLKHSDWMPVITEHAIQCQLRVILRTPISQLQKFWQDVLRWNQSGLEIEFVLSEVDQKVRQFAMRFLELPGSWYVTYLVRETHRLTQQIVQLNPSALQRMYFYVPMSVPLEKRDYSARALHRELQKLQLRLTQDGLPFVLRGPRGLDIADPRIQAGRDLNPDPLPVIDYRPSHDRPKISVIIPCFNPAYQIISVLSEFLQQTLNFSQFEVLVVDDGSDDGTEQRIRNWIGSTQPSFSFRYFYISRHLDSGERDAQFRAGIARNLGAQASRGEILSFLDADMLVPPEYLSTLLEKLQNHDLVQCRRQLLQSGASHPEQKYQTVDPRRDLKREETYWEKFKQCHDWMSLHNHWKYVCTYSLSLRKELFWRAGGFRKSFFLYGFEDTELGFKLAMMDARFLLADLDLYHLAPPLREHNFHGRRTERTRTLTESCRIFYHHHLSIRIFSDFHWFLVRPQTRFSTRLEMFYYDYIQDGAYFIRNSCLSAFWSCYAYARGLQKMASESICRFSDFLWLELWPKLVPWIWLLAKPYFFLRHLRDRRPPRLSPGDS